MTTPYIQKAPIATQTYRIFLSSGSDATALRDRVERMVDTISKQFAHERLPLRFETFRWEHFAASKASTANPNDLFVAVARDSHLTIVLLLNEVREGTREEIEGVLDEKDAQLAVVWCKHPDGLADKGVQAFLESHKGDFLYQVESNDAESTQLAMLKILARCVASAVAKTTIAVGVEPISQEPEEAGVFFVGGNDPDD
jgi:hypothetical protein